MSFNDGFNIRSVPWPSNTPVSGNTLVYNGSQWIAGTVSGSGGSGTGDITAVNAGTNLTGGGDTGDVTVSLSSSVVGLNNLQTTTLTASHVTGTDLKIDYIDFNNNLVEPTFQTGRLHYDPATSDLIYDTNVSGVTINIGQQTVVRAKNTSGSPISKGKFVRITGGSGSFPVIALASWTDEGNSANTIGAVMQDVLQNGFTYVLLNGTLEGVNTNNGVYNAGDLLYLSSSGDFTKVQPLPPKHAVRLGQIVRAQTNNGVIFVKVDNGYELGELHDVYTGSVANGDLLVYNTSLTAWNNSKTLSGNYTVSGSFVTNNIGNNIHLVVSGGLFSTLQQAVDISVDGDVILVGPNTVGWGDVSLPQLKKLSIVGLGAKRTPLVVKVGKINFGPTSGATATVNEIHLENLYISSLVTSSACVNISGTAPCRVRFEGCYINNAANSGNGIFMSSSNTSSVVYLNDCMVYGASDVSGAGLWTEAGTVYINNCDFDGYKHSLYLTGASVLVPYTEIGLSKFTTRNAFDVVKIDGGLFSGNSNYFENLTLNANGIRANNYTSVIITNSIFNIATGSGYVVTTDNACSLITGSNTYTSFNSILGTISRNNKVKSTVGRYSITSSLTPTL